MNITTAPNINYLWAHLMIEELIRNCIDSFCISSGSRSSPLTLAVATNPKAKSFIHFDERGSAFQALGLISATKRPCVVITTSGTAAANVFPAVIEASKKKLPLIILTADRPPELRWTGSHQTIDQTKIYGEYVRWYFDMPCPNKEIAPQFVLTTIDQAVSRAKGNLSGPVHINSMFREPLAPIKAKSIPSNYSKSIQVWQKSSSVYTSYVSPKPKLQSEDIEEVTKKVQQIKSGIIVVGKLGNSNDRNSVLKLAEQLNWPIFADISSGLRLGSSHNHCIHYFDQILLSEQFQNNIKIDGVLHIGGRITSKRWYEYIKQSQPKHYMMVINHPLRNDPLHNVTTRIQCDVNSFAKTLVKRISKRAGSSLLSQLQKCNERVDQSINQFFKKYKDISEPQIARSISQYIPSDNGLFVSSSMPIRDLDMYSSPTGNTVTLGSNRGASGIDGTIATAVGFLNGLDKQTTLLIGDLAFLYDLNSLAMVKGLKKPLVIVVLNNNGGGIFSFLPIQNIGQHFEKYFGTPHQLTFPAAAELFDLNYAQPQTIKEFNQTYKIALKGKTSTIIEVQTERTSNLKFHDQLQTLIKNNINEILKVNRRGLNNDKKYHTIRKAVSLGNGRKLRRYQVR